MSGRLNEMQYMVQSLCQLRWSAVYAPIFIRHIWMCCTFLEHNNLASLNSLYQKQTAIFWVIMQWVVLIPYRHFRTTYRSYSQGSRIKSLYQICIKVLSSSILWYNDLKHLWACVSNFILTRHSMHYALCGFTVTELLSHTLVYAGATWLKTKVTTTYGALCATFENFSYRL
jgi:hypothetical protein